MNSTNTSSAHVQPDTKTEILYFTIKAIICAITVVGNALVIFLIFKCRRLRVLPNTFIVSLAIADLMVGAIIFPSEIVCQYCQDQCDFIKQRVVYDYLYNLSVANICALTLDRYIATERPLQYNLIMTKKKVVVILVIAWISPAFIQVPGYILIKNGFSLDALQIINMVILQLLPPILLVVAYIRMTYTITKLKKQEAQQINQINFNYGEHELRQTRASATVKITGAIIIIFVVCYCLAIVRRLYHLIVDKEIPYPEVAKTSRVLLNVNSAVNVFVYAFMKGDFRQELQRKWKWLCFRPTDTNSGEHFDVMAMRNTNNMK